MLRSEIRRRLVDSDPCPGAGLCDLSGLGRPKLHSGQRRSSSFPHFSRVTRIERSLVTQREAGYCFSSDPRYVSPVDKDKVYSPTTTVTNWSPLLVSYSEPITHTIPFSCSPWD